jgi:hypothetical protein
MLFRTFRIYSDYLVMFMVILSEVSPARLRYELPKLGIAGSNPALRIFTFVDRMICLQICGWKKGDKLEPMEIMIILCPFLLF